MKTKLFTLLLALLSANGVFAWDRKVQIDDLYYYLDETAKIAAVTYERTYPVNDQSSYSALSGAVVIPSSVNYNNVQYSVTSIDGWAFQLCTGLTSITIPENVTSIEAFAFRGCTGLTSITIPENVTSIGRNAFEGCTGLTSITIPENVTNIGEIVFYGCTGLTSLVWDARNCTIDGDYYGLFSKTQKDVSQIVSLTIGNNVESIPDYLCYNMRSLTSITIPESVTSIGSNAFYGCIGLTSIVWNARNCPLNSDWLTEYTASRITSFSIGSNIETLPDYLCSGMSSLTSITIPESVKSIGKETFSGCKGLTSITIPESVTSIGRSAFSGCTGLTSITIPNSVTSISDRAFFGCTGLTSINIPESVTNIGVGAFAGFGRYEGNNGLESITVAAGNTVYNSHDNCNAIIETATNKLIAGCRKTIIPNNVTSIGAYAFYGCGSRLSSITIPNSVTSIGEYAFYACIGLNEVTLGSSLEVIGKCAFELCEIIHIITCYNPVPPIVEQNGFKDIYYTTAVFVPAAALQAYQTTEPWKNYKVLPITSTAVENVSSVLGSMTLTDGVLTLSEPLYMEIYTVSGVSVFCGTASSVSLPTPGIYLLRSQGVTQKITVH